MFTTITTTTKAAWLISKCVGGGCLQLYYNGPLAGIGRLLLGRPSFVLEHFRCGTYGVVLRTSCGIPGVRLECSCDALAGCGCFAMFCDVFAIWGNEVIRSDSVVSRRTKSRYHMGKGKSQNCKTKNTDKTQQCVR